MYITWNSSIVFDIWLNILTEIIFHNFYKKMSKNTTNMLYKKFHSTNPEHVQYLVTPPRLLITAEHLLGIDSIKLWCNSVVNSWFQTRITASLRSLLFFGWQAWTFLAMTYHRFSIGFRSGELPGQSRTVILYSVKNYFIFFEVWHGAESCWKIQFPSSPNCSSTVLSSFVSRTCLNTSEFIVFSTHSILP